MSSWTRRFLLIPQAQAKPDAVVSAITKSGKEDEISLIVGQPKKDKRYRPYRDTLGRPIVGPPGSTVPSEKLFEEPHTTASVRPRLYGEPERPIAGNLIVPSGGSRSASRFFFNKRNETHLNNEGPVGDPNNRSTFQAPGDAQYRQSPVTFGKSPDILMANHYGLESDWTDPDSTMNIQGVVTTCRGGWKLGGSPSSLPVFRRGQYLGRPKLLALSDGRLMATWLSTFLPPSMSRYIGEGKTQPGGNDPYAVTPPPNPTEIPRSIYTTVYSSFLDPSNMLWSKPQAVNDPFASGYSASLPINGPNQNTPFAFSSGSNVHTSSYGVFFDSVEFPDTGEIVSVWMANDIQTTLAYEDASGMINPPYAFLNESTKSQGRYFYCGSSTDGGETFSVKCLASGSNTSTSDIPGLTDQFDPSMCLAGCIEILDSGRLVVCIVTRQAVYSLISDDRGASWRASKIREYKDLWFEAANRKTSSEEFRRLGDGQAYGRSGWMWADCDFTKTEGGTAVLVLCLADDEVFFDVTHAPDDNTALTTPWQSGNADNKDYLRTGFHGMSTFVYSTSSGESYGEPIKISNWGYSQSTVSPVSRLGENSDPPDPAFVPNYQFSRGFDTSLNEEHFYYFEQNPGAVGASICMRPDGLIQVYLAVHNWGTGIVYDGLATRTLSVEDLSGGESTEEVLPTNWSEELNRRTGNVAKGSTTKSRSYSFVPVHMQFSRAPSSGWAGSMTPPVQISTNEIYVDYNESLTQDKILKVLFIADYYETDPDSGNPYPTPLYSTLPTPQDGEAILVSPEPDPAWSAYAKKLAVYDAALGEFTFHDLYVGDTYCLMNSSTFTMDDPFNPGTPVILQSTADMYVWDNVNIGKRLYVNGGDNLDNVPNNKMAFNGANSVAAVQWRGEIVVSVAHVDMQHQLFGDGAQWRPYDPNAEDYVDGTKSIDSSMYAGAFAAIPGNGGRQDRNEPRFSGTAETVPGRAVGQNSTTTNFVSQTGININPASGGTDLSSISIYRTCYWQPLRENLPASMNISRTSVSNLCQLGGGISTQSAPWFPACNSLSSRQASGSQASAGATNIPPGSGEGYEDNAIGPPYLMSSLLARAYNFCWDAHTPPEIGNNYAVFLWNASDATLDVNNKLGSAILYDRSGELDTFEEQVGGGLLVTSPFTYASGYLPNSQCANEGCVEADVVRPVSNVSPYTANARWEDRKYTKPCTAIDQSSPYSSSFGGTGLTSCVRVVVAPLPYDEESTFGNVFTTTDVRQNSRYDMTTVTLNLSKIRGGGLGYDCVGWAVMLKPDKVSRSTGVAIVDLKGTPSDESLAAAHEYISDPVWFPWPESYGDDTGIDQYKFLEILVSTQESKLRSNDGYTSDVKSVTLCAYARMWDRYTDPDWTGSFTNLVHNHNLVVKDTGLDMVPPSDYDVIKFGCRPGRTPYESTSHTEGGVSVSALFKSVHVLRSDSPVFMGDGRTISGVDDLSITVPRDYDGFILSKAALGANIVESGPDVLDGLDSAGNVIYSAGFAGVGTCDPATVPIDDDRFVYPLGPPFLGRSGVGGGLADVDSGITNGMRPSRMTASPPQWIDAGAKTRWTGTGAMPGVFSYQSGSDYSPENIMTGPTALEWRSLEGTQSPLGPALPSGGDSNNSIYTKETTTILLDAFGDKGYATDGNYTLEVLQGASVDRLFRPTGIAVFGRNFGSMRLTLTNDPDNLESFPYTVTFGLMFDGYSEVGGGTSSLAWNNGALEPNKYTHIWSYTSVGRTVNSNILPMFGPNTFSFSGDGDPATLGLAQIIDYPKEPTSPDIVNTNKAPFRPGQFKSHKNGPSFYIQVTASGVLDDSSNTREQLERARCVYKILDNDATTLFLDSNPLDFFNASPSTEDSGFGEKDWRNVAIFSDRFGSQLNYQGLTLRGGANGDFRGQGYRYAKIEINGCTHFSDSEKSLRLGRIVLGELVELSAPDFEWGWSISQESGTNLLTTEGGPRYSNVRHAPRRVFQVEHAAMLPPDEPLEGVVAQPLRGFGGHTPPGRYAEKRSWAEVVDMIRRMNIESQDAALFWEGELALDQMPLPSQRAAAGSAGSEDYMTVASPDCLMMVRLTQVGGATHEGYVCRPVVDGSRLAPRPLMKITSMTFEEEF